MALQSDTEHEDEDQLEATEMHDYVEPPSIWSHASIEPHSLLNRVNCGLKAGIPRPLRTFWNCQISVSVSHDLCRDHFGMNRSAYLA